MIDRMEEIIDWLVKGWGSEVMQRMLTLIGEGGDSDSEKIVVNGGDDQEK